MIEIKVTVEFDDKIKITDEIRNAINKSLVEVGLDYIGDAKSITPVDTGNLRESYKQEVKDGELTVTNTADYSAYVEFGDLAGKKPRRSGKIPFMRPTLYDNIDKYFQHIVKSINEAL